MPLYPIFLLLRYPAVLAMAFPTEELRYLTKFMPISLYMYYRYAFI